MTRLHPEAICQRCGRLNVRSWHAPSPLWNAVMRDDRHFEDRWSIICPPCFAELASDVVDPGRAIWHFTVDDLDIAALWTDPDGRLWDPQRCMWVAP